MKRHEKHINLPLMYILIRIGNACMHVRYVGKKTIVIDD